MTTYKLYKSDNTANWIQYKINEEIAEFDTCNIDHKNIKDFFKTLKTIECIKGKYEKHQLVRRKYLGATKSNVVRHHQENHGACRAERLIRAHHFI